MNRICFCSVIHPQVLPYLHDFIDSLEKQTFKSFDLLLFVDGIENKKLKFTDSRLNIQLIKAKGSPAAIRTQLLNYVKESSYEFCVFGDADDYFAANRIATSLEALKRYDLVVNDVSLITEEGNVFKEHFWKHRFIENGEFGISEITDVNFVGLGNTAIRVKALPKELGFPKNTLAVDWLLFSRMLLEGSTAFFTSDTRVFYRQYEGNTIGLGSLDMDRIQKGIRVKLNHYDALKELDASFEKKLALLTLLDIKFKEKMFREQYFDILKHDLPKNLFWWEEVKIIEELLR